MQDKTQPDVKKILSDLAAYLKVKGIRGLAAEIGETESRLYAWIRNKNIAETGAILAKCPNINRDWLKTGEGEMFREGGAVQGEPKAKRGLSRGGAAADGEREAGLLPLNPDDVVVMQVYVTGGAGAPFEFIPAEPIEEIVLPRSFYTKSIVPVKVRGRSMERTLRDGAVVGVDRSDRQIVNGELFAVWLPYQGTVIKRLYLDNKKIQLQSDNEEFRPRDIEVALNEVDENFIQGRVKWVIQLL